ncbi:helix-turn-helix transcriptional regulator [Paenarthrobacter nicotinovorans]|uniref:helix-turn-helix transcriptional regulator n=1 Tax=Paenarthrobacter nicotinovorans TaxID=29320 RepID=UPI0037F3DAEE
MTMDQTFEVRLRLKALSEEVEDSLVEYLGALVSRFSGVPYVTIFQDATSGMEAAHRLLGRVKDFGCEVVSVDPDFVTRTEIAERLGASRQAVSHWVSGQRQAEFPFPLPAIQAGISLWCWSDVVDWARASKHLADEEDVSLLSADEIAVANGELAAGRMPVFA